MKKHILITTILASVLIISMIVSADGKGKGAVLTDMIELDPPSPPTPQEEAVGGANINVNANNTLILNMHINNGAPGVGFDLLVLVYTDNDMNSQCIGEKWDSVGDYTFMVLNEQGCGSAQAKVQLDVPEDYTGDSVFVFFHSSSEVGTKPSNSWFCYAPRGLFPYPVDMVEVPLKK
jgi:hypothetical protein